MSDNQIDRTIHRDLRIGGVSLSYTTKVAIGTKPTYRCQATTPFAGLLWSKQHNQVSPISFSQTIDAAKCTISFLDEMIQSRIHIIAVVIVNQTVIDRAQRDLDTAVGINLIGYANQLIDTSLNTMGIDGCSTWRIES